MYTFFVLWSDFFVEQNYSKCNFSSCRGPKFSRDDNDSCYLVLESWEFLSTIIVTSNTGHNIHQYKQFCPRTQSVRTKDGWRYHICTAPWYTLPYWTISLVFQAGTAENVSFWFELLELIFSYNFCWRTLNCHKT